jgi:hypothetical protein
MGQKGDEEKTYLQRNTIARSKGDKRCASGVASTHMIDPVSLHISNYRPVFTER